MSLHLRREIEKMKKMILSLSARVEENVQRAARSISRRDPDLAQEIIDNDPDIDQTEVDVEEECLKILALHQPVAHDLRYIIATLKINNDLERIGDLTVNIAQGCQFLIDHPRVEVPFDFTTMARKAQQMVGNALDALVNEDPEMARDVINADEEVDEMHSRMYEIVERTSRENAKSVPSLIRFLTVSHNLERIADHATNIAEDVIYMSQGKIIRHQLSH